MKSGSDSLPLIKASVRANTRGDIGVHIDIARSLSADEALRLLAALNGTARRLSRQLRQAAVSGAHAAN